MTATIQYRVVIGSDDAGQRYKDVILKDLQIDPRVLQIIDVGVNGDEKTHYPHVAVNAACKITSNEAGHAILICGKGLGVAISAKTMPGIRAVTAHDSLSVERAV